MLFSTLLSLFISADYVCLCVFACVYAFLLSSSSSFKGRTTTIVAQSVPLECTLQYKLMLLAYQKKNAMLPSLVADALHTHTHIR